MPKSAHQNSRNRTHADSGSQTRGHLWLQRHRIAPYMMPVGASQHHNPVLGCLSVIISLSAPGSAVGPQVASHAPLLCRALAPRLYLRPRALRGGLTRQCEARGLVGSRGCTSTPAATCLRNPHFHGRRTAAHWWLRRGTATRALVLVGWLTRWIRAVVGRSQAGWAAAHATRPCSGCPHPPPDRIFA